MPGEVVEWLSRDEAIPRMSQFHFSIKVLDIETMFHRDMIHGNVMMFRKCFEVEMSQRRKMWFALCLLKVVLSPDLLPKTWGGWSFPIPRREFPLDLGRPSKSNSTLTGCHFRASSRLTVRLQVARKCNGTAGTRAHILSINTYM